MSEEMSEEMSVWDTLMKKRIQRETEKRCSYFPEGTRFLIETTASTLGPGEFEFCEERVPIYDLYAPWKTKLIWRVERVGDRKPIVSLGIGDCGFWTGSIEELPNELK